MPVHELERVAVCSAMLRRAFLVLGLFGALLIVQEETAVAQKAKRETEKLTGTVVSAEKGRGKNFVVTIKDSTDKEHEFQVTPRIPFHVSGRGDAGFLRPGVTIQSVLVSSNNMLFGKEFTVYTGPGPAPAAVPHPDQPMVYDVVGKVLSVEGDVLTANFGPGGTQKVNLEENYTVTALVPDPEFAKPGLAVEVEGYSLGGGKKFNPTKITVQAADGISSVDVYAEEDAKSGKGARAKSGTANPDFGKTEEVDPNDPFGVKKKGAGAAPKK